MTIGAAVRDAWLRPSQCRRRGVSLCRWLVRPGITRFTNRYAVDRLISHNGSSKFFLRFWLARTLNTKSIFSINILGMGTARYEGFFRGLGGRACVSSGNETQHCCHPCECFSRTALALRWGGSRCNVSSLPVVRHRARRGTRRVRWPLNTAGLRLEKTAAFRG